MSTMKMNTSNRRTFNKNLLVAGLTSMVGTSLLSCKPEEKEVVKPSLGDKKELFFKLSLAQWSFHRALKSGKMDPLDFAKEARALGFEGIEYVNQFYKGKATDNSYLHKMNVEARKHKVKQLLIMVDGEGSMADLDKQKRLRAVDNHKKWLDAASALGCHSIRVNCHGEGSAADVSMAGIEGLSRLSEIAAKQNLNVIVENHGGYSSDGNWMSNVIKKVNKPNCGTLPDFGNFCTERKEGVEWSKSCIKEYDKYKGITELMPYAKAVSAKSNVFNENGQEKNIDYGRILKIVKKAGYSGYIGVEYEGETPERDGIIKTRDLLISEGLKLT